VGGGRAGADHQVLEIAAGGAGDRRGQLGGVLVDVLAIARGDRQGAGGGAIQDREIGRASCRESVDIRGVGGGGGEQVVGDGDVEHTRSDRDWSPDVCPADLVGGGRAGADHQVLEIAAGGAGDRRGQLGGVLVDVLAIARGDRQGAGGGAIQDR